MDREVVLAPASSSAPGSLIIGGGLTVWIGDLFLTSPPVMQAFGDWLGVVTGLSAAFAAGYSIRRIWPWTYGSGRIVWIAPVFLLLLFFSIDLVLHPEAATLRGYFWPRSGEEDLGVTLFTWPTVSCCLYSAGMAAGHRRSARFQRGQQNDIARRQSPSEPG
jgi:hypothetical protein